MEVSVDQVIQQYIEEEGRYPERIAMIFWSGTNMRTKGCDIAQAMALLGVSPEWNTNGISTFFLNILLYNLIR